MFLSAYSLSSPRFCSSSAEKASSARSRSVLHTLKGGLATSAVAANDAMNQNANQPLLVLHDRGGKQC